MSEPELFSIMPMNSGKDYKARKVDVAQPVMASGQTHGDQGGDVIVQPEPPPFDTTQVTSKANRSHPKAGDPCHPLAEGSHAPAIAFSSKDHGADCGEVSPTLRKMGHDASHANGGGQVAVAMSTPWDAQRARIMDANGTAPSLQTGSDASGNITPAVAFQPGNLARKAGAAPNEAVFPTLGSETQGDQAPHVAFHTDGRGGQVGDISATIQASDARRSNQLHGVIGPMTVRRLTPTECERLQGFEDGHTEWGIDEKGQRVNLSDSARYRQMGNAVTVNVTEFLGRIIAKALKEAT